MNSCHDTFRTPFGDFSIAVNASGAVIAAAFGRASTLQSLLPKSVFSRDPSRTNSARRQIEAYLSGKREKFNLSLAPQGTLFQQKVWRSLQRIPRGQTMSYGALANSLGHPGAARAVGRANATNPICLIIPCHRVVGADGSLTGYAYGKSIKEKLLQLEGVT